MVASVSRPYFKYSLADLEALFTASGADPRTLERIRRELQHRDTDRAARLRKKVADALRARFESHA